MRPGWLARSLPRRKGLARSLPSMLAAQQSARARRVKLACRSCGRIAAFVDEDPAGTRFERYRGLRLLVRSGNVTRRNLQSVSCPVHGHLLASWTAVLPVAVAARDGRVRRLRLPPVSSVT
jgi:hypothetical protein